MQENKIAVVTGGAITGAGGAVVLGEKNEKKFEGSSS